MPSLRSASVAAARRLIAGLACAALLLINGCVLPVLLHLQIVGFEEAAVQGVGIWHESGGPDQWELLSEIPLTIHYANGKEWLYYDLERPDGSTLLLASTIERDIQDPDRVTMRLQYISDRAGSLRASVYNAAGHSALSLGEIEVQL